MNTKITGKHALVSKDPWVLYMAFADLRNFVQFIPEDKKEGVSADYDTIRAKVQGFDIGVRVSERVPYSMIAFQDDGAPFHFEVKLHFDSAGVQGKTDFWIELDAELNLMMKMMLGSKLKDALDKISDGLASVSEGKLPDGVDPSMFPSGFNPASGFGNNFPS
ncbi:MAG: hypothetical protein ACI4TM_08925 [Candidatus Cryptobacteroides sp.]